MLMSSNVNLDENKLQLVPKCWEQKRMFQTSMATRDIDSACKYIGAGAATIGVAGSGKIYLIEFF